MAFDTAVRACSVWPKACCVMVPDVRCETVEDDTVMASKKVKNAAVVGGVVAASLAVGGVYIAMQGGNDDEGGTTVAGETYQKTSAVVADVVEAGTSKSSGEAKQATVVEVTAPDDAEPVDGETTASVGEAVSGDDQEDSSEEPLGLPEPGTDQAGEAVIGSGGKDCQQGPHAPRDASGAMPSFGCNPLSGKSMYGQRIEGDPEKSVAGALAIALSGSLGQMVKPADISVSLDGGVANVSLPKGPLSGAEQLQAKEREALHAALVDTVYSDSRVKGVSFTAGGDCSGYMAISESAACTTVNFAE